MSFKEIGERLKRTRKDLQLSLDDISTTSKIHPSVIEDLENGSFERFGHVYIKSFLKKYSNILRLDPEDMVKQYEDIVYSSRDKNKWERIEKTVLEKIIQGDEPVPEDGEAPIRKKPSYGPTGAGLIDKDALKPLIVGSAAVLIVILIFVFTHARRKPADISAGPVPIPPIAAVKNVTVVRQDKPVQQAVTPAPSVRRQKPVPAAVNKDVVLVLRARGEVWVKVTDQKGGSVFVGTLRRGDAKEFKVDSPLTVWTGRGEVLDFSINGDDLGNITDGVERDIIVSTKGIKIGNNWIVRLD